MSSWPTGVGAFPRVVAVVADVSEGACSGHDLEGEVPDLEREIGGLHYLLSEVMSMPFGMRVMFPAVIRCTTNGERQVMLPDVFQAQEM